MKADIAAVLVILCGHQPRRAGALELWHAASSLSGAMTLVEGTYGIYRDDGTTEHLAAAFEAASRATSFARGVGLPGMAWASNKAHFQSELTTGPGPFVRGPQAADAGLLRGLGFSVETPRSGHYALTFLAEARLPLAHRIERWRADPAAACLLRVEAFSELHGGHSRVEASLPLPSATTATASVAADGSATTGVIARAWTSALPAINEQPQAEPGPCASAAAAIGASGLLAVPILRNGMPTEILALYF
jgi:hypothetical protein